MNDTYELSSLNPAVFENLVNALVLKVLGSGATGFGPGGDGGRDGYFEGEAAYPSSTERWNGTWYIQSKFHAPHLSTNAQNWLIQQVRSEIKAFTRPDSSRQRPDNWIIATNIDLSGITDSGSYDTIKSMLVSEGLGHMQLDIWGGQKIIELLRANLDVATAYGHFLTPGHVLTLLYEEVSALAEERITLEEIVRFFVVTSFTENLFTKLDRAGAVARARPAVHDLFIDLPYSLIFGRRAQDIFKTLAQSAAQCHRYSLRAADSDKWRLWSRQAKRARVFLIKGGPGQGKSTIGQYLCQVNRAHLLLESGSPHIHAAARENVIALKELAVAAGFWPTSGRIPIQIELKEYAHWRSKRDPQMAKGILSFIAESVERSSECRVYPKTIKNALRKRAWIAIFDGLDEVPNDQKDDVAKDVMHFLNDVVIEIDSDILAICTSRPQGYSGQFATLDGPAIDLALLDIETSLRCADPLLRFGQSAVDGQKAVDILKAASVSPSIRELMTTPLQAHIMATVVRDGGRPPERRWRLFQSFYEVMRRRESQKDFDDPQIAKLLREEDLFLKAVHMRLGFALHARAEVSAGAQTMLTRSEFKELVTDVIEHLGDPDVMAAVAIVMEATTDRLVLVSTPDSGEQVRFDIRQLQEFFAAEFLYADLTPDEVGARVRVIGVDAHWREVMHFLLSALIAGRRRGEFSVAVIELGAINAGDPGHQNVAFKRRTSPASLVAGRLLVEGVVEESKHDRSPLKPLFSSVGGVCDLESLRFLAKIRPPKSKDWMVEQLLERTTIASPLEYVGALYVLGLTSFDSAPFTSSLNKAFCALPFGLQTKLIKAWAPKVWWDTDDGAPSARMQENHHNSWVTSLAMVILSSDQWLDCDPTVISHLINICRIGEEDFLRIWHDSFGVDSVGMIISKCLEADAELNLYHSEEEIDCGVISAGAFGKSWLSGGVPPALGNVEVELGEIGGAFEIMLLCLSFARNRSTKTLMEFATHAERAGSLHVAELPNYMLALVPLENWQSDHPCRLDHLMKITAEQDIEVILATFKSDLLPPYSGTTIYGKPDLENDWETFLAMLPLEAIKCAFGCRDETFLYIKPDFTKGLEELVLVKPHYTCQFILLWGQLLENNSDLFYRLKAVMGGQSPLTDFDFAKTSVIYPFKFDPEEEGHILTAVGPALIFWWLSDDAARRVSGTAAVDMTDFESVIAAYGLTFRVLHTLARDNTVAKSTRSAALGLAWLTLHSVRADQHHHIIDLNSERLLYHDLVDNANEDWLSLAFVHGLLLAHDEGNRDALQCVTELIDRSDRGADDRAIVTLIRTWRERSLAPVNSKNVLSKWLGYQNTAPSYAR